MTVADKEMYFNYDAAGVPVSIVYNGTSYYYVTNLQGDVVGIVNQSGNQLVAYTYDAWGNVLTTTGSSANTLGKYNPLRYRGYVYDTETKLYYLQSRYYNPEWGRFINADAFAATGQGILGNNMFAYCNNNPVSYSDNAGYSRNNMLHLISPGAYAGNPDLTGYPIETPEEAALKEMRETGMSFYKGIPLTQANDGNSAFTFGYIFMGIKGDENLLKHEYGHTVQTRELGVGGYTVFVVLPSVIGYAVQSTGYMPKDIYYSLPWEYKADKYGGATHKYQPWAKKLSDQYWCFAQAISAWIY